MACFFKDIAVGNQMGALPYETMLDDTRHKAKLEDQLLTELKLAFNTFTWHVMHIRCYSVCLHTHTAHVGVMHGNAMQ